MTASRVFLTISLFFVLLASACAPAVTASPVADASAPTVSVATQSEVQPEATLAPTESALPVATSRGPDLEATDPATVALASGGLQLVEFFRFTWGTCRSMALMVHGLEAKYFGKIKFSYLDADDPNTADFQRTLGFRFQPEFYLLDASGQVLQKWVGFVSQEDLENAFRQYAQ